MSPMKPAVQRIAHQAEQAYRSEDLTRAMFLYRKALKLDKNDAELLKRYGHVLAMAGYLNEAVEVLERANKRRPNHPATLMILVFAKLRKGDIEGVHQALDRALTQDPTHGPALLAKVNVLIDSGTPELAEGLLDEAMGLANPDPLVYIAQGKLARSTKDFAAGIDAVNKILSGDLGSSEITQKHLLSAQFTLGHLLDATGDYDGAFAAFHAGNEAQTMGTPTHAASTIGNWSADMLSGLGENGNESERPVIIIGMPRSGTTLTEQIIAAHPQAGTVGEAPMLLQQYQRTAASNLTADTLGGYATEYLAYLEAQVGSDATRVIDKHMNADKTAGMIAKMFPNARLIHCLRDPVDCCLSAYFQHFGHNLPYARDLRTIGEQYVAHRKLMDHWNEVLERPIYTSVYEELVDDPEPRVRAMLEHLGLPWDDSCMRFHESKEHVMTASATQVRRPIYKSSKQRWKNYEKHLGPLLDALGPYAPD